MSRGAHRDLRCRSEDRERPVRSGLARRVRVPPAGSESEVTFAPLFRDIDLQSEQIGARAGFRLEHLFILTLAFRSALGCPGVLGRELLLGVLVGKGGVRQPRDGRALLPRRR